MKIHLPPKVLALSLLSSVIFHYLIPIIALIPNPYNLVGYIVILVGFVLILWTRSVMRKHKTTLHPSEQPSSMITIGPFQISRNPFYLGYLLIATGVALVLGSLSGFVGPMLFFVWMNTGVIPKEEASMFAAFGIDYAGYEKHVRRWI